MASGTPASGTTRRHGVAMASLCALGLLTLGGCPRASSDPPPAASVPTVATPAPSPAPTPAPSPAPTSGPTDSASGETARWVGSWANAGCGQRRYERRITLASGGEARGEERVSPCPAGVACVWSGIVPWQGRWKADGDHVRLELEPLQAAPSAVAPPAELGWDAAASGPAEIHGAERCAYHRLPSAP